MVNLFKRFLVRIYLSPYQLFSFLYLRRKKMKIITGADSTFYASMIQLIESIKMNENGQYYIIAYDLGLSEQQRVDFKRKYPEIKLTLFEFAKYSSHYDLNINAGAYAWKPQIIAEEFNMENEDDFVFWLDAGCVVRRPLLIVRAALHFFGFYSIQSGVLIKDFTNQITINLMGGKETSSLKMLSGGVIAFNKKSKINNILIKEWAKYADIKHVISPLGSSRDNHRFDQSIVSILFYQMYRVNKQPVISKKGLEILTHKNIWQI